MSPLLAADVGVQGEVLDLFERGHECAKDGDRVVCYAEADASSPVAIYPERSFRRIVTELRLAGYPVVSVSEARSVYRKARDVDELEAFIARELLSRASVLHSQAHNLREHRYDHLPRPRVDPIATNETLWED